MQDIINNFYTYFTIGYFILGVLIAMYVYANKETCIDGETKTYENKHPVLFYLTIVCVSIPFILWVLVLNLIEIFTKKEGGKS